MTRSEFIKAFADAVAAGRRKQHRDMRPSEEAVSRMDDEKTALNLWNKHRSDYSKKTVEEFYEALKRP